MDHPRIRTLTALLLGALAALAARPADAIVAGARPAKWKTFRVYGNGVPIGNTLMATEFAAPQVNVTLLPASTATLTGLPADAVIEGAYLFWAGSYGNAAHGGPLEPDSMVKLRMPDGATLSIGADGACQTIAVMDGFYKCRADVTSDVKAHPGGDHFNGDYTVSEVDADPGHIDITSPPNCENDDPYCQAKYASWTLIVVYSSPSAPLQRDIHIYDGYESFDETDQPFTSGIDSYTLDGFLVGSPPVGEISYWGMEGDALLGTPPQDMDPIYPCDTCFDSFAYQGTKLSDGFNPAGNVFNSTPALGFDLDTFKIGSQSGGLGLLSPGDTSAVVTVSSGDGIAGPSGGSGGGEFFVLGWTLLRLNRPAPSFRTTDTYKTVDPPAAGAGETLFYTVQIANAGSANATSLKMLDALPPEAVYVPGSARIDGVACTDAADSDACTFAGGTLSVSLASVPFSPPGDKVKVTFRAQLAPGVPDGKSVCNAGTISYAEDGGEHTTVGPACVTTAAAVLGTPTKKFQDLNGGALAPDDLVQFTVAIPASRPTTGVGFVDDIPAHMHLVSVSAPAGSTDGSSLTGGASGGGRVKIDGISVPSDTTPAQVSFIVRVSNLTELAAEGVAPGGIDGLSLCNQGTVTVGAVSKTTDDPDTGAAGDATCRALSYQPGFGSSSKTVVDVNGGRLVPGDALVYTINLVNTGSTAATVNLSDPMPPGVTGFVPLTLPPGGTFFPAPAGANGTGLLTLAGVSVAPGATATAKFQVTVDPAAVDGLVIQNAADMTVVMFPSENRTLTSPPLTVFARPDLGNTSKTATDLNGGDVQPGDIVRYTITVPNDGSKPATAVVVTDVLDPGLDAATVTLIDPGTFDAPSRTITWDVGTLGPGASAVLRFQATIRKPLPNGTVIANQARVTSGNTPPEPSDDPATAAADDPTLLAVVSRPDFRGTTKTVTDLNGGAVEPGDVLRYTVAVHNDGTAVANDVTVNDAVDPSLGSVVPGSGGTALAGLVVWNVGALAPGETRAVTFDATVVTPLLNGTVIANQAFVRSSELPAAPGTPSDDPGTPVPSDPTLVTVTSHADLSKSTKLAKDENLGSAQPGDVFTYEVHVKDTGNSPATAVTVSDVLDGNLTFVEALDGGSYNPGARTVTWTLPGMVAPGTDGVVRFRASIATPLADGTVVCNQAHAASPEAPGGPVPTDDPTTPSGPDATCVTVVSKPELVASTKTVADVNGGVVEPGDVLAYTVTARNTGTKPTTAVVVTDVVPALLTAVTVGDGGVFDAATHTVTWTLATLAAKEDRALHFTGKLPTPLDNGTVVSNQAQLKSADLPGPFVTDDPATPEVGDPTVVKVVSAPRFTASKDVLDENGGRLEPDDFLTYTITVANTGNANAHDVVVSDVVDAGKLTAVTPAAGGVYDAASKTITWAAAGNGALGLMAPGASGGGLKLTFRARIVSPIDNGAVICNQANVTSDEMAGAKTPSDDPRTPTPADATCGTVFSAADFSNAAKTAVDDNGGALHPGDTVTYSITFTNTGNTRAADVVVLDPIDASLEAVTPAKGGVFTAGPPAQIRWDKTTTPDLASVAPATTVTLTFTARVKKPLDGGTVISNQARVSASGVPEIATDDPSTSVKGDATRLTVTSAPDLSATTKTALDENGGPLRPKDFVTWTIKVSNGGDALARNLTVTDVVDAAFENVTVMDGGTFDAASRTITWKIASLGLAPAGDVPLHFRASVKFPMANGTVIANQAKIEGAGASAVSDDPATAAVKGDPTKITVVSAPKLDGSTKTVSGDAGGFAGPGVALAYVLHVINAGDDTAHAVVVTDRIDATLDTVTPADGGVFDAATRVITWTVGDLPPGERALHFSARVRTDAKNGYVIKNQGAIAATGQTPVVTDDPRNGVGDHNTTDVTVNAVPRMALSKTFTDVNGGQVAPGDVVRYAITVANVGAAYAYDVTVDDPVDQTNLVGFKVGEGGALSPGGIHWASSTTPALAVIPPMTSVVLDVEATVRSPTANGTVVSNQARAQVATLPPLLSDDPGTPAPADATKFTVVSVADLSASSKTVSDDSPGTPVLPNDLLTYTIRVLDSGTDTAHGVKLIDPVPASTTLVAGSVRLNGGAVADGALAAGLTVQSPGAPAGDVRLGEGGAATVTFKVQVAAGALSGTVISNQGLLFAAGTPSTTTDDPRTPEKGDPTQVVVGGGPLLRDVTKLYDPKPVGGNGDALFDVGEEIDYRVSVSNTGDGPAHAVVFRDKLPANAAYVAGTLTLQGVKLTDPVDGDTGEAVANALTVRLGTLPPGAHATVGFRARIVSGTEVVNQGRVTSDDTPPEDTDADGNDGNGNQPTVTPVGRSRPTFAASKTVYDVNGGAVEKGDQLLYVINVTSTSQSEFLVDVYDDLPDGVSYVADSATSSAASNRFTPPPGGRFMRGRLGAEAIRMGPLASTTVTLRVKVDDGVACGKSICNTGEVHSSPSDIAATFTEPACVLTCAAQGTGSFAGEVFEDHGRRDHVWQKGSDGPLPDFVVQAFPAGRAAADPVAATVAKADGSYSLPSLPPGPYLLRVLSPQGAQFAQVATADLRGGTLGTRDLPVDPSGRVYDATNGTLLPDARAFLYYDATDTQGANQMVPEARLGPKQQGQRTTVGGMYHFDVEPRRKYRLAIEPPGLKYGFPSTLIPATPGFAKIDADGNVVPNEAPDPKKPNTPLTYFLSFDIKDQSSSVFHNHVPLDPLSSVVHLEKRVDRQRASVGDPLTYTITVRNRSNSDLTAAKNAAVHILDHPAAGLRLLADPAHVRLFREKADGTRSSYPGWKGVTSALTTGRVSTFADFDLPAGESVVMVYQAVVGLDAREGNYENDAVLVGPGNVEISNHDKALVRVVNDPEFDQGYLVGRVFCDGDGDGAFDVDKSGGRDRGILGARVYLDTGWFGVTDVDGKFHLKDIPPGVHLVKLDTATVPPGSTLLDEESRVVTFTRGLPAKIGFPVRCEGVTVGPQDVTLARKPPPPKPRTVHVEGSLGKTGDKGDKMAAAVDGQALAVGAAELAVVAGGAGATGPAPDDFAGAPPPNLPAPGKDGAVPVVFHLRTDVKDARGHTLRVERVDPVSGARESVWVRRAVGAPAATLTWDGREGGEIALTPGGLYAAKLVVAAESGALVESPWRRFAVAWGEVVTPEAAARNAADESAREEAGSAAVLRGALFRNTRPTPELVRKLGDAARKLPKAGGYVLEVHTDEGGSPEAAQRMSQAQADAARGAAAKALGVAASAVTPRGLGRSRPLQPGITPGIRRMNRRVVLRVADEAAAAEAPRAGPGVPVELPALPPEPERVFVGALAAALGSDGSFSADVPPPASGKLTIDLQRRDGRRAVLNAGVAPGPGVLATPPAPGVPGERRVRLEGDVGKRKLQVDGRTLPLGMLGVDLAFAAPPPDGTLESAARGAPARLTHPMPLALTPPVSASPARRWWLQLRRADGVAVGRWGADGPPPPTFTFTGADDAGAGLLQDGTAYGLRLVVENEAGDRGESPERRFTAGALGAGAAAGGAAKAAPGYELVAREPSLFTDKGAATPALRKALVRVAAELKRRPAGERYRVELLVRGQGAPAAQKARRDAAADEVRKALMLAGVLPEAATVEAPPTPPPPGREILHVTSLAAPAAEAPGKLPPQVMVDGERVPVDAQGAFSATVAVDAAAPLFIDVQDADGRRAVLVVQPARFDELMVEPEESVPSKAPGTAPGPGPIVPWSDIVPGGAPAPDAGVAADAGDAAAQAPGRATGDAGVAPPPGAGGAGASRPPPDGGPGPSAPPAPPGDGGPSPGPSPSPSPSPPPAFKPAPPAELVPAPSLRGASYLAGLRMPAFALLQAPGPGARPGPGAGAPAGDEGVAADLDRALGVPAPAPAPRRKSGGPAAADLVVRLPPRGLPLRSERLEIRGHTAPGNELRVNGQLVAVEPDGTFATMLVLPFGPSTIEIKTKDKDGNVATIAWPVEVARTQLFLMALADGAVASARSKGHWSTDGAAVDGMTSETTTTTGGTLLHGRGVVYVKGRIQGGELWNQLTFTGQLDTAKRREFEAFYEQVIDPTRYYPVYGDAADEVRDVRARDKLYVVIEADESKLRIGNFRTGIKGFEVLSYDRAVYGAEIDFRKGWHKEHERVEARAFASRDDARLVHDHNILRATGGSIYYLRHGQLVPGGERVHVVVRDRVSGLVLDDRTLARDVDYTLDAFGGRLMMKAAIPSVADGASLSNPATSLSPGGGHPVYVEVDYDFQADAAVTGTTAGGQLRGTYAGFTVGGGIAEEGRVAGAGNDYKVYGAFSEWKPASHTRLRGEFARSTSTDAQNYLSEDGGLTYLAMNPTATVSTDPRAGQHDAWKLAFESDLAQALGGAGASPGGATGRAYVEKIDRGFFSSGSIMDQGRTKYGAELGFRFGKTDKLVLRHDGILAELPQLGEPSLNPGESPLRYRTVDTETFAIKYTAVRGATTFDAGFQHQHQSGLAIQSLSSSALSSASTNRDSVTGGMRRKINDRFAFHVGQEVLLYASGGDPLYERGAASTSSLALSSNVRSRFVTEGGVDVALTKELTLSGTEAVRWSGANATMVGLKSQLSPTANFYVRERFEDRDGGMVTTTIVGSEDKLQGTENGRVYGEYQLDGGSSGERNRAIMGLTNRWRVAPGLYVNGNLEHQQLFGARLPDGTPIGDQSRSIVGFGHEWLRARRFKLGGRLELRLDDADAQYTPPTVPGSTAATTGAPANSPQVDPTRSQPGDPAYADRTALPGSQGLTSPGNKIQYMLLETLEWNFHRDLTLFGRALFSQTQNRSLCSQSGGASVPVAGSPCTGGIALEARFVEMTMGLALRPAAWDWISVLARYSLVLDSRPLGLTSGLAQDKTSHIAALSPIVELPLHFQMVEKLAWKRETSSFAVTPTDGLVTTTNALLWINRLNFHLTRAVDAGAEYRVLRLFMPGSATQAQQGALLEVGFWVNPYTRLGAGWNFSHFSDNEMADLNRDSHGFFMRVVGKY